MPYSSLAAQLKKLQAPQSNLLVHRKEKTSFLFDPKEAANLDRDTFYELGVSGLEELKKLNPLFSAFEDTLFDVTSKSFERSVQTDDVNEKLNHNIKTFLLLLSPYFLIKPAHRALEWLINRYHVESFNADELMMCALPYHETMTFARLIQILPSEGRWYWLALARESGGHLTKKALLARVASDPDFLRFICDIPRHAIKVHGNKASSLTTLYGFYCSSVVGGLMEIRRINSGHITNILPSIVRGLSSSVPDYIAAVFVVIGVLATKALLAEEFILALYNKISKVDHAKLRTETCLALIILSQCETGQKLPNKAVGRLAAASWLPDALAHWIGKGIAATNLVLALISSTFRIAQRSVDTEERAAMKDFLIRLLNIKYDEDDAHLIFRCLLSNMMQANEWCKDMMIDFETRYPSAFDKVCSEVLAENGEEGRMLTELLNINTSRADLLGKLLHPVAQIRQSALEYIASEYPAHQAKWLTNAVVLRLEDTNVHVVKAALKCREVLAVATPEELVHPAIKCLTSGWAHKNSLISPSISLFSKCPDADIPAFLFATIPVAFFTPEIYKEKVLQADRFKTQPVIAAVNEKLDSGCTLNRAIWQVIVDGMWPPLGGPGSSIGLSALCEIHPVYRFLAFVAYAKTPEMQQFLSIADYINAGNIDINGWSGTYAKKVTEDDFLNWLTIGRKDRLPVGAMLYYVSHYAVGSRLSVDDDSWFDPVSCDRMVKAFVTLVEGSTVKKKSVKKIFVEATNEFLQGKFSSAVEQLTFLLTVALAAQSARVSVKCIELALNRISNASAETTPTLMLCLLSNPSQEVREAALALIESSPQLGPFSALFSQLMEAKTEITLDPEQIVLFSYTNLHSDPAVESLLPKNVREAMKKCRSCFVKSLACSSTPIFIKARLLHILECVSSVDIVTECYPKALSHLVGNKADLNIDQSAVVRGLISKLNVSHAVLLQKDSPLWECIDDILFDSYTIMHDHSDGKLTCPSAYLLNCVSKEFYDSLPDSECQLKWVDMVVSRSYNCESPAVSRAATGFFKRVMVDGLILAKLLTRMKDATATKLQKPPTKIRKSLSDIPLLEVLELADWKKGIFVLEQVQAMKKFSNVDALLNAVFDVLAKCLLFEEQLAVEYPKQLALSLVVKCCGKMSEEPRPDIASLRTDLVVQCVRASQDPQTHHHALLALTVIAEVIPDQVLHCIMDVFTFIGSTVLRQDDAYSLQIISKLVEIVIPVLIKDGKEETVVGVIRVFVAAMLDVPEHRRLTLFMKLLDTIEVTKGLWLYVACVLESHTDRSGHLQQPTTPLNDVKKKGGEGQIPKKLEFALQLCLEFPLEVLLKTILRLLEHAIEMPHDKRNDFDIDLSPKLLAIFDVRKNTGKQLRNYKYVLILFLSSILSSDQFVRQITEATEKGELSHMESTYTQMVQVALTYIRMLTRENEEHLDQPSSKYWKVMLSNSYELLDKTLWLVPGEAFSSIILRLITVSSGSDEALRRKCLELLGMRLSQGSPVPAEALLPLVKPIQNSATCAQSPATRQAALFAAKLLIRHLAMDHVDKFKQMLEEMTCLLEKKEDTPEVLGSLALCIGELVYALKAHSIFLLAKFVPCLLELISNCPPNEIVQLSLVTALQKVIETLYNFLSPYMSQILHCLCVLSVGDDSISEQKTSTQHLLQRIKSIRSTISSGVRGQVLVPAVASCYAQLVAEGISGSERSLKAIEPLLSTLSDSFQASAELSPVLSTFLLNVLSFRADASYGSWKEDPKLNVSGEPPVPPGRILVEMVEPHAISTVSSLVLKLSETSFRPLYNRLYDWAVQSQKRARIITFYRLSSELASCLRGLFALFAGLFTTHASGVLKSQAESGKLEDDDRLLVDSILKTLLAVFTYDSHSFLTKDRFSILMQPLVDQLEVEMGISDYQERCKELLTPCIAHMAAATNDDSLWKNLNYQVLLKTRHQSPQVRLASVETVCLITNKLGEDFLPLLPETVPFLAELLEDPDETVEKQTHRIISSMENVLGEPIQKYF